GYRAPTRGTPLNTASNKEDWNAYGISSARVRPSQEGELDSEPGWGGGAGGHARPAGGLRERRAGGSGGARLWLACAARGRRGRGLRRPAGGWRAPSDPPRGVGPRTPPAAFPAPRPAPPPPPPW